MAALVRLLESKLTAQRGHELPQKTVKELRARSLGRAASRREGETINVGHIDLSFRKYAFAELMTREVEAHRRPQQTSYAVVRK